jgi:hypothetical protein
MVAPFDRRDGNRHDVLPGVLGNRDQLFHERVVFGGIPLGAHRLVRAICRSAVFGS